MSVFTTLTFDEVAQWLQSFNVGNLTNLKGIAAGITNTNYFVVTDKNRYVLTVFEKNTSDELPYFVDLMAHLAQHGVPCPSPIADNNGICLHKLHGKPVLMVSCLVGKDIATPNIEQVKSVAFTLAKMHLAGLKFTQQGQNQRDENWRNATAKKVMPKLSTAEQHLLQIELTFQHDLNLSTLVHGVVHGDLFRDNVLFEDDTLGGFIDFYYACDDYLLYDVAIAVNEWCLHHNGADIGNIDQEKVEAFLEAYQVLRPFTEQEKTLWTAMLRRAALRFWLSRLYDFHFPQEGELTHTKDPNHFKKILQQHITFAKG